MNDEEEARRAERVRIEQEIRSRYAGQLAAADICDSLQIEMRIRAEVAAAIAELEPRSQSPRRPQGSQPAPVREPS